MYTKLNILFYGSCHCISLYNKDINGNSYLENAFSKFNVTTIYCYDTQLSENEFTSIIKNSDIIITQPISDNYRNKPYLSLSHIVNISKKDCKIIVFPPLDFHFYYFDLDTLYYKSNYINIPSSLHLKNLFKYFIDKKSIDEYLNDVFYYKNFMSDSDINSLAEYCFSLTRQRELLSERFIHRENYFSIKIEEFYRKNYKNVLLSYTLNHPSAYVSIFLAQTILNILEIDVPVNKNANYFLKLSQSNEIKVMPIYDCIRNILNFDSREYISSFDEILLNHREENLSIENACKIYYKCYNNI